ncbi:MAG: hypothetical protein WC444_06925 [Candidatus Paceibacterota bacterium]
MKSIITIVVESEDNYEVFPEEGQSDENFETSEKKFELRVFRAGYAIDMHKALVQHIEGFFDTGDFEEHFFNGNEDVLIEDMDSFEDYKVKISVKTDLDKNCEEVDVEDEKNE